MKTNKQEGGNRGSTSQGAGATDSPSASTLNADLSTPSPPALLAHDLHYTYCSDGQETRAVRGVSVELAPGEFVALTGRSGCGKSTLLYLLGLMLAPDSGTVTVDGEATTSFDDADRTKLRREKIGFVFQRFNLIPVVSARENIRIAMRIRRVEDDGQAERLLEEMGIAEVADKLPGQMSVGQQQRVAIARALAGRPAVLLADEPTGNLDSQTAEEMLALLRRCNQEFGQTILMITHDPQVAAAADRVIHMTDGHIDGQSEIPFAKAASAEPDLEDELAHEARLASKRVDVRAWFHFFQIYMMLCLAAVICFSIGMEHPPTTLGWVAICAAYLAYMSMACTFLPLPTTALILWLASTNPQARGPQMNAWLIAAIGAVGTMIANLNDYHIVSGMLRFRRIQKIRHSALVSDAIKLFSKAPFVSLTLFAFFPVPVDVVRLLAIGHGYSRVRFSLAYLIGRFPRYFLLAILSEMWKPSVWEILGVMGFFGLLAIIKLWRDHAARKRNAAAPAAGTAPAKS